MHKKPKNKLLKFQHFKANKLFFIWKNKIFEEDSKLLTVVTDIHIRNFLGVFIAIFYLLRHYEKQCCGWFITRAIPNPKL